MHSIKHSVNLAPNASTNCCIIKNVRSKVCSGLLSAPSANARRHLTSNICSITKTPSKSHNQPSSTTWNQLSSSNTHQTSKRHSSLFAPSAGPMGAMREKAPIENDLDESRNCDQQTTGEGLQNLLQHSDQFHERHIGPRQEDVQQMLTLLGYESMGKLIDDTVPEDIRFRNDLNLPAPISEHQLIEELQQLGKLNHGWQWKNYIGMGYYDCIAPPAIMRNVFENPGWTTAYTAYQAEIAQGRLESLMNYQTMVADLTGLEISNASLLDEATAAAEAMQVCTRQDKRKRNRWLVSKRCFPQTLAVVQTRADALGIQVDYFNEENQIEIDELMKNKSNMMESYSGLLVQNPDRQGFVRDLTGLIGYANQAGCLSVVATDLLACTQMKPPGEMGAQLCVGSSQRFGVPLNFGGPHAGFLSCTKSLMRSIPGRIVGLTRDSNGQPAYRFALQTREQHIRRDKATSNICTAQALLANISAMYAVYHGPEGLTRIGASVHQRTSLLAYLIEQHQIKRPQSSILQIVNENSFFDTLTIRASTKQQLELIKERAASGKINLRIDNDDCSTIGISLDETTKLADIFKLASLFNFNDNSAPENENNNSNNPGGDQNRFQVPLESSLSHLKRSTKFLTHPVFNSCKSEAQLVRYIKQLENKDVSLAHSMIPLGSCTMKLNATSQMLASSWPQFNQLHPFQPRDQVQGYMQLIDELEKYLCEITGYDQISFQPNSGAQGEYAGLRCIRAYLESINQTQRNVCLIPVSAHGTNPASAQMAGFKIKPVRVNQTDGSIDLNDLRDKIKTHAHELGCLMVTYPSTFGIFDSEIRQICDLVHQVGGQVYLDGANMNAQVGICRPGDYGSDVSHLNLHKTFCIPHGGGGPGVGPIGVKAHLAPFLPSHPNLEAKDEANKPFGTVSANHWGSPAVLPISWSYIRLMSTDLRRASEIAILNANYMVRRLENDFKILYRGPSGNVAHEFIMDCSVFKKSANVEAIDIAKRLQDFGLHAPTVSWPVNNSLMLEPTECEDKAELDRYCDALLAIRQEIRDIEEGRLDQVENPLKMAPHTQMVVCNNEWRRNYSREQAAFPANFLLNSMKQSVKVWPTVGRVDDIYGDTNLFCTCPPVEEFATPQQETNKL